MAILAGIDEVGYGPKLGPLIVCATAFRVADPSWNLWKELAPAVSTEPHPDRIAVADSKELYTTAAGVGDLETAALPFLSTLPDLPGSSFRALLARVALDEGRALHAHPWYDGADFPLPQAVEAKRLGRLAAGLWETLVASRIMTAGCWASWTEPDEFNRAVSAESNKADYLFAQSCRLVRAVLAAAPGEEARIRVGKQGGRRFYLPGLVREFGTVWVLEETRETSRYELRQGGRRVVVEFLLDGERRDFALALASMIGKYLREGAMRLFNAWWASHLDGLRSTAGYGRDASRFWNLIEPHLGRLRVAPESVLRAR